MISFQAQNSAKGLLEERDAASSPSRQFVYGAYIDEPLVMDANGDGDGLCDGAGDDRYFYHANTLYSVAALTDAAGAVVEAYAYDPYGRHWLIADGDADGEVEFDGTDVRVDQGRPERGGNYLFTGRRLDHETRSIFMRHRYYLFNRGRFSSRDPINTVNQPNMAVAHSPNPLAAYPRVGQITPDMYSGPARIGGGIAAQPHGRMISRDPIGRTPYVDGPNLYQYVRSNPQLYVDPYGLMTRAVWDKCCRDSGEAKRQLDIYRKQAALIHNEPYGPPPNIGCGYCAMGIDGYLSSAPIFTIDCWEWRKIKANRRTGWPPVHQFVAMKPKRNDTPTYDHPRNHASPIFDGWDTTSNFSPNSLGGIGECHFSEGRVWQYKADWPRG